MLTAPNESSTLSWTRTLYDMINGKEIFLITLRNKEMTVTITNIGCAIISIHAPDRSGQSKNIVAGFADPSGYIRNPWYFGCVVGRVVNRIGGARFFLEGREVRLSRNDGNNHLHGGFGGLHTRIWDMQRVIHEDGEVGVVLGYTSPDGEEGYPGNLHVQVKYTLNMDNRLSMDYTALTDKPTPVNLSNHSYFNLSGFEAPVIIDHVLMIPATRYTEKDGINLPTGNILPVSGTPLDFTQPVRIGKCIDQFPLDKGFDHNYVLAAGAAGQRVPAAELYDPYSGRRLRVTTDRPGIQLYTANWWDGTVTGSHGIPYVQYGAVALETQAFPDSPNHPQFPDTILSPGETYRATTTFEFDSL
jgi:aldose 1-epimerase